MQPTRRVQPRKWAPPSRMHPLGSSAPRMTPRPERRSRGVGSRVSWPRSPAPLSPYSSASPPSQ
eukprot:13110157-Alexandrium_andersonii.AAC.1